MKKILLCTLLLCSFQTTNAYTYIQKKVDGKTLKVIEYSVDNKNYKIKTAITQPWVEKPVAELLKENNMISWVNGVFFCPSDYSFCADRPGTTNNERYVEWEKFAVQQETGERVVFAFDTDGNPFLFQSGRINYDDEDKINYGFSNWPALLHSGSNMLERYYEVGLIDNKMMVKWTRNFVCSTQDKKKVYFWLVYDVTIDELVNVLSSFWCFDALNLDAWLSTTMMYNNRLIVWPQRPVIDVLGIERVGLDTKKLYENITPFVANIITLTEKRTKFPIKRAEIINRYIAQIDDLRVQLYNANSKDILETNIVWETENVGYQIELKSLKTLKASLILNEINNQLKNYTSSLPK